MPLSAKSSRVAPRRRSAPVAAGRARKPAHGYRASVVTPAGKVRAAAKKSAVKAVTHTESKSPTHAPATPGSGSGYAKAVKFLETLTDFERLRVVRYNAQNFDLERMRGLLKKLGNPQNDFKSVH